MGSCQSAQPEDNVHSEISKPEPPKRAATVEKQYTPEKKNSNDADISTGGDISCPITVAEDDLSHQSSNSSVCGGLKKNLARMRSSESYVGLDKMIENRKQGGCLQSNVVHIEVPCGTPIEEIYDGVHSGEVLGSGISGTVRLATHRKTGINYAVKCLDLGLIDSDESLEQLRQEIYIMCELDHPNIVRLEEVYESQNEIYLVQELCSGGELFDRLDEQPDYHYTEEQCAGLVNQMLSAVRYIHSKGIVHRDLKLENFLFSTRDAGSELKMIDFGLSKHFSLGDVHHEAVGTPYTVAPEVIRGSYDERCDVWAIGVITFLLLSGDPPFGGCGGPESITTVRDNILSGKFSFEPHEIWENVSFEAKEFITKLLVIEPVKRLTIQEAQNSHWINGFCEGHRNTRTLNPNVVNALVAFKEYSDMRKLLCEVLSFTLIPDQIQDLRKEFQLLDNGSGEITLDQLKHVLSESAGSGNLGGLIQSEVEDIFNAMRVRKSTTTIQWHEFIAAGLSQCKVDDRNLRLAFDRLDSEHKGFITVDNVMDLLGSGGVENGKESIRVMFEEGLTCCNAKDARITYDDFLLLMKGQTMEALRNHEGKKKATFVSNDQLEGKAENEKTLLIKPHMEHKINMIGTELHLAVNLPEHEHDDAILEKVLHDDSKSPLVVNRYLYRSHRNLRLAVLDASKRFEELHQKRLEERLVKESLVKEDAGSGNKSVAGLVLRRGLNRQNSDIGTKYIKLREAEQKKEEERLAKAQLQAGRGRRSRKKIVSDLAGMISPLQEQSAPARASFKIKPLQEESLLESTKIPSSSSDGNLKSLGEIKEFAQ